MSEPVFYQLTFHGAVRPEDTMGETMIVEAEASLDGLASLAEALGVPPESSVHFSSNVSMGPGGSFEEKGTIAFGDAAMLRFESLSEGQIDEPEGEAAAAGAVIWRIVEATGALKGAKGLITSAFSVTSEGEYTDHQTGHFYLS